MPCLVAAVAFVALVFFTVSPSFAQTWFARGQFHEASDELRAPGFWGADSGNMVRDDGSNGDVVAGDGIFSCLVPAAQAPGRYEFKIASLDWSDEAPVGFNINCVVETFEADEPILVTFDTNVYSDGWIPTTRAVWSDHLVQPLLGWFVVGGVPELGSWDPTSGLVAVPSGDLFRAVVWIDTVGPTEYKWTADLSWVWQEVGGQGFSIRDIERRAARRNALRHIEFRPPRQRHHIAPAKQQAGDIGHRIPAQRKGHAPDRDREDHDHQEGEAAKVIAEQRDAILLGHHRVP